MINSLRKFYDSKLLPSFIKEIIYFKIMRALYSPGSDLVFKEHIRENLLIISKSFKKEKIISYKNRLHFLGL